MIATCSGSGRRPDPSDRAIHIPPKSALPAELQRKNRSSASRNSRNPFSIASRSPTAPTRSRDRCTWGYSRQRVDGLENRYGLFGPSGVRIPPSPFSKADCCAMRACRWRWPRGSAAEDAAVIAFPDPRFPAVGGRCEHVRGERRSRIDRIEACGQWHPRWGRSNVGLLIGSGSSYQCRAWPRSRGCVVALRGWRCVMPSAAPPARAPRVPAPRAFRPRCGRRRTPRRSARPSARWPTPARGEPRHTPGCAAASSARPPARHSTRKPSAGWRSRKAGRSEPAPATRTSHQHFAATSNHCTPTCCRSSDGCDSRMSPA